MSDDDSHGQPLLLARTSQHKQEQMQMQIQVQKQKQKQKQKPKQKQKHRQKQNSHHNHLKQHKHKRQASVAAASDITTIQSVVQVVEVNSAGTPVSTESQSLAEAFAASTTAPSDIVDTTDSSTATSTSSSGAAALTSTPSTSFTSLTGYSNSTTLISSMSISTGSATLPTSTGSTSMNSSSNSTTLLIIPSSSASGSATISGTLTYSSLTASSLSISSSPSASSTSTSSSTSSSPSSSTSPSSSSASASLSSSSSSIPTSSAYPSSSSYDSSFPSSTPTSSSGSDGGATETTSGSGLVPTASSNDDGLGNTASTPVIVGSVVGSLAGIGLIFALLMLIWRWKKRNNAMVEIGSTSRDIGAGRAGGGGGNAGALTQGTYAPDAPDEEMTQRRSILSFGVPAAFANFSGKDKRTSHQTEHTISSTAGSERGFYKVSGRKLPSVFRNGGDGYGGEGDSSQRGAGNRPFYRDSEGFYASPVSPTSPSAFSPAQGLDRRESGMTGIPIQRPSPARTPVIEHPAPFPLPTSPPPRLETPPRPDLLGRSRPSQDGSHISHTSHTSRFTEEV